MLSENNNIKIPIASKEAIITYRPIGHLPLDSSANYEIIIDFIHPYKIEPIRFEYRSEYKNYGTIRFPIEKKSFFSEHQLLFATANLFSELASVAHCNLNLFCEAKDYLHLPKEIQNKLHAKATLQFEYLSKILSLSRKETYTVLLESFTKTVKKMYDEEKVLINNLIHPISI